MKKISNYFKQLTHKSFLAPFLIFGILLNLILFFIMQFIEKEFLGNSHILTLAIYFSLIGIMHYKLMVKNLTESIFVSFRSLVALFGIGASCLLVAMALFSVIKVSLLIYALLFLFVTVTIISIIICAPFKIKFTLKYVIELVTISIIFTGLYIGTEHLIHTSYSRLLDRNWSDSSLISLLWLITTYIISRNYNPLKNQYALQTTSGN